MNLFISRLSTVLQQPLPGAAAQLRMAPPGRGNLMPPTPQDARLSAVLVLFYPKPDGLYFPLIRRPQYDGAHSGQIALPGGKYEESDRDLKHTALREAQEEIGVNTSENQVIGSLSDIYIPVSKFLVQPIVAYSPEQPLFKNDPAEVAEVLEVSVAHLLSRQAKTQKRIVVRQNIQLDTPCYELNGHIVWGATAMMLSELEVILTDIYQ